MSDKIDAYRRVAAIRDKIRKAVSCILGRDDPRNDKHTFRCSFSRLANQDWSPIIIEIYCSHGYYGSSSGYSDTSEELGKYMAKAINTSSVALLNLCVDYAEKDAQAAKDAAKKEAEDVLKETSGEVS